MKKETELRHRISRACSFDKIPFVTIMTGKPHASKRGNGTRHTQKCECSSYTLTTKYLEMHCLQAEERNTR